jgi:hypothetical protein
MGWRKVGSIGVDHGAYQDYDSGSYQDYDVGADEKPLANKAPGPSPAPKFRLPAGLAERLRSVPSEPYDIYPSYPSTTYSSALSANTASSETTCHTFIAPTGSYVVLNPGDVTQEALFETFTSNGRTSSDFIAGMITIYAQTGLQGKSERVYAASSEFHNPFQNMASIGNRRKWQLGYIIVPGESMLTKFFATVAIGTSNAHLDHKVSVKNTG